MFRISATPVPRWRLVPSLPEGGTGGHRFLGSASPLSNLVIRLSLNMTQEVFAETYHLEIGALRAWEQQRCRPDKAARPDLKVIAGNPDIVRGAIRA